MKKFLGNLDWIILNKIFIELKFVEHLKKFLNTWDNLLVKFELIRNLK